jgi:Tfp pilus assembly protein PilP
MRAAVLIVVLLTPVLLGGCGSSEEDDAQAAVCAARDDIAKEVEQLQSLTVTTATTSQVSDGLQAIRDELTTIRESRDKLSDDRRKELQAANDAFAAQIRELAGTVGRSVSVEGAATELETSLDQLATSYRDSFGELDCS